MKDIIKRLLENKITKKLLYNRNITTEEDINEFMFAGIESLSDPFLYTGVKEIVERINQAKKNNDKVLICGDYDTDGISASFVLCDYLRSLNIETEVHIPHRLNEGYGINLDYIFNLEFKPNLIITVDCGISCADEIEKLQKQGIDVIVTDHHNIPENKPNCIIFDPKQDEGLFNAFCGAGVAMKLVQALGGVESIKKYLDIVAIATIGDIVPLIKENRVIVKLGLEKLNIRPERNLKLLMDNFTTDSISSEYISFMIVPLLNSSGRMGNAERVFNMLIEKDENEVLRLINEIKLDNQKRLELKKQGIIEACSLISQLDLNSNKILVLKSEKFNEGVVGIIASNIANQFKRPAIILADNGNEYKGSGRSYGEFNLHNLVMKEHNLCEKVGGHDYAVGLTIRPENYEKFVNLLNFESQNAEFYERNKYEFEIDVEDVSDELYTLLNLFEPFGFGNEKPQFMIKAQNMSYDYLSTKTHKHFVLNVDGLKIISFFGAKFLQSFDSSEIKELIVELSQNKFNGKTFNKIILKDVITKNVFKIKENEDDILCGEIYSSFINQDKNNYDAVDIDIEGLCEIVQETQKYETIFIVKRQFELDLIKKILKTFNMDLPIRFVQSEDSCSMVFVTNLTDISNFSNYKRIVYLSKPAIDINFMATKYQEIYVLNNEEKLVDLGKYISLERKSFGFIFSILQRFINENKTFDDIFDIVNVVQNMQNVFGKSEIMLNICVFLENKLIKFENNDNGRLRITRGECDTNALYNSTLYQRMMEVL